MARSNGSKRDAWEDVLVVLAPDDIRIRGTRVGIETVLYEYLVRRTAVAEIVRRYPSVTVEQVDAVLEYHRANTDATTAYLERWLENAREQRAAQWRRPSAALKRLQRLAAERDAAAASV